MNSAMNRTRLHFATMLMVVLCGVLAHAQGTLLVLVLDGKSGNSVSGRTVTVHDVETFSKSPLHPLVKGQTDQRGVFATTVKLPERITIEVKGRYLYESKWYGANNFSVNDILSTGIVDSNLCSSKVLRSPMPGELILFVRHESLKELFDMD